MKASSDCEFFIGIDIEIFRTKLINAFIKNLPLSVNIQQVDKPSKARFCKYGRNDAIFCRIIQNVIGESYRYFATFRYFVVVESGFPSANRLTITEVISA